MAASRVILHITVGDPRGVWGERPTHRAVGKRVKTDGAQPPDRRLYSIGCTNSQRCRYVVLGLDVSGGRALSFLVDSGADISLVKSEKLLSTVEFEPRKRVRIRSVEGSVVETHGSVEAHILEVELSAPIKLQLVSK